MPPCQGFLVQVMKILSKFFSKIFQKNFFKKFSKKKISGFSLLEQETFDMRVFIYLLGSPTCKDLKKYMWEVYFRGT